MSKGKNPTVSSCLISHEIILVSYDIFFSGILATLDFHDDERFLADIREAVQVFRRDVTALVFRKNPHLLDFPEFRGTDVHGRGTGNHGPMLAAVFVALETQSHAGIDDNLLDFVHRAIFEYEIYAPWAISNFEVPVFHETFRELFHGLDELARIRLVFEPANHIAAVVGLGSESVHDTHAVTVANDLFRDFGRKTVASLGKNYLVHVFSCPGFPNQDFEARANAWVLVDRHECPVYGPKRPDDFGPEFFILKTLGAPLELGLEIVVDDNPELVRKFAGKVQAFDMSRVDRVRVHGRDGDGFFHAGSISRDGSRANYSIGKTYKKTPRSDSDREGQESGGFWIYPQQELVFGDTVTNSALAVAELAGVSVGVGMELGVEIRMPLLLAFGELEILVRLPVASNFYETSVPYEQLHGNDFPYILGSPSSFGFVT